MIVVTTLQLQIQSNKQLMLSCTDFSYPNKAYTLKFINFRNPLNKLILMLNTKQIALRGFCLIFGCIFFTYMNGQNLDQHLWKNRVIIIKSNHPESSILQKQVAELTQFNEEMGERKLVLYQITQDQYKYINFQNITTQNSWHNLKNSRLQKLTKSGDFKVQLIGLDGGIKLEQAAILTAQELFNLIDSMPMRKAEISKLNKN